MRRRTATALLVLLLGAPAWCDNELATLAGPQLAKAAEGFVRQAETDPQAIVVCDATIADQKVPVGRVELRPHWSGASPPPLSGRVTVPVSILVDGHPVREVGVPCRIQTGGTASDAVKRGDAVTLVITDSQGALRIEVAAVARDAGGVGDVVKAEILSTHKVVPGHVNSAHKVVVP